MYPTNLDAIYWEVINLRDIISNIKNMDFHTGPLPSSFRKFNAKDTKTPKGPSNNERRKQPSRKSPEKKGSKVQNESTLSEWKLRNTEELINLSGHKAQNQTEPACLQWDMRWLCFSDCLHKAYHVNSHTQDRKGAIAKHIVKVRSGRK